MGHSTQARPQIGTQEAAITEWKQTRYPGTAYASVAARKGGANQGKAGNRAGTARSDQAGLMALSISSKRSVKTCLE